MRPMTLIAALMLAAALSLAALPVASQEDLPPIERVTVYPDTVLVADGQPQATVVFSSADNDVAQVARDLHRELAARYGVEFPLVSDAEVCPERLAPVGEQWRQTNLIVVGNLYSNRALMPLYALQLCGADSVYPGGDGYELRTVSNPWGTGRNMIVVGGSSVAGMQAGVAALIEALPDARDGRVVLPRLHQIEPGGVAVAHFDLAAARVESFPEATSQASIHYFWLAAHRYHWTGDERWAEIARDRLSWFNDHFAEGKYAVSDYSMQHLFRGWDLLEESPSLSDADRVAGLRNMVTTALTMCRYGTVGNVYTVGGTHSTVPRWAMWRFARYLQRTLPDHAELMTIAREWEANMTEYFEGVLLRFRDHSDWRAASVDVFVRWAAAAQESDYFTSGNARAATLWAVNENDTLGYHNGMGTYGAARTGAIYTGFSNLYIIQLAAFVYDDPRLRWLSSHLPNRNLSIYAYGGFPFGTCAWTPDPDAIEEEPEYLKGLTLVPVSERRHEHALGGEGVILPPLAECFDKACFRSGFEREDQYLLLQGVDEPRSQNVNVIPRYTDRGQVWLVSNSSQRGHYYRNALYLSDGRNEGALPTAARLDAAGRFAGAAMIASTYTDYRGADWQRAIFWRTGEWFLVMDRATIRQPGFYAAQSVWRLPVAGAWSGDRELIATQGGASMHIIAGEPVAASADFERPAGGPPDIYENPFMLRQRRSGEMAAGEVIDFHNLLVTTDAGEPSPVHPVRVGASASVIRPREGDGWLVAVGGAEPALGIEADAGIFMASRSLIHLAGVSRLTVDSETVFEVEQPLTGSIDLTTGMMTLGHDGDELRASALTWELQDLQPIRLLDEQRARAIGELIAARIAQVAPRTTAIAAATGSADALDPFETIWETGEAGRTGRPIESVAVNIPGEHTGRPLALVDGVDVFRSGAVSWPENETATVELTWPERRALAELRLWMFTLGRRNDMSAARVLDEEREVTLVFSSDGFRDDLRERTVTVRADWRSFPTYKGCAEPQKVLVIPTEGVEASGVRIGLDRGPTDWRGNVVSISEIEALGPGRGPLAVSHLVREDLDGDGVPEWLVGSDCWLSVIAADGGLLWQKRLQGEVTAVDAGDLDGDGTPEVLVGSYDMYVYALRADGSELWRADLTDLREQRPDLFTQAQGYDSGPIAFDVGFWEPMAGTRRVLVGGYESTLLVLDDAGALQQIYYPGYSMFQRRFVRDTVDLNADGLRDKLMCSMKYGSYGILHALIAGADGLIADQRRTSLPDNLPWVTKLLGEARERAVIITPVGFGLYDLSANFPEQTHRMGQNSGLWQVAGGRSISAGLVHDLDGDGEPEVIVGGADGFLSVFSLTGECRAVRLIGEAINALAAFGSGDSLALLVATDSGLSVYDNDWQVTGRTPKTYRRLQVADAGERTLIAATADGRLELLRLRN